MLPTNQVKRTRAKTIPYPKSVREHRLAWLYKPIWKRPHAQNKMFTAVACAPPGSGKSWLQLAMSEALDRSHRDVDRFSIDRVYFSALEFARGMAKKWPRGTCHVFDDAGLNLFSREAMQRDIRDLCKIFQSIRYRNYIIFLSLPTMGMLDKVVRQLMNAYIQPVGIDFELERSECKFHYLNTDPKTGNVYHYRPVVIQSEEHPFLGHKVYRRNYFNTIWIDRPSDELAIAYETKKKNFMDEYYKKVADGIEARAKKKEHSESRESKFNFFLKKVNEERELYLSNEVSAPVIDYKKILLRHSDCPIYLAQEIARTENTRLGLRKVGKRWMQLIEGPQNVVK